MPEAIQLRRKRTSSLRCPYCHDDLAGDELRRCALCATSYHLECAESCASLGCQGSLEPVPAAPQATPKSRFLPFTTAALVLALALFSINGILGGPKLLKALSLLAAELSVLVLIGAGLTALYRRFLLPAYLRAAPPSPPKMARCFSLQAPSRLNRP